MGSDKAILPKACCTLWWFDFSILSLLGCILPTVQRLMASTVQNLNCAEEYESYVGVQSTHEGYWDGPGSGGVRGRQGHTAGEHTLVWANSDGVPRLLSCPSQTTMPSCVTSPSWDAGGRMDGMPWLTSVHSMLLKLIPTSSRTVSNIFFSYSETKPWFLKFGQWFSKCSAWELVRNAGLWVML